ncbi:T9SS type A sorting domain-containing protein [Acidiluteibacter ferrifornacis]|uniref:T9SS type A sorting domain-containing protein n=1 Tax=Acidiluteibacter ferrifornacis TaxID=2692424 RepID=A0A6N9NJ99_9FLAO|nr:T9SS type A sorting domain-containing protein [Acidiluteibacter ferrifornacis]NBG65267.1 T9SS type A sorting domain-containing protein [Acidiluteibacter ferrifornacis]
MKKGLTVIFILFNFQFIGTKAELCAQPSFAMDTTFQPFFNFNQGHGKGYVSMIWENPVTGTLHVAGSFRKFLGNDPFYSLMSMHRDGSRNFGFQGFNVQNHSFFYPINDSVFISSSSGFYFPMDIDGNPVWQNWLQMYQQTVSCSRAYWPYFFPNGSSLMTNSWNGNPNRCLISNPPNTYLGQSIVKVDSLGYYDSTFQHTTDGTVSGFWPYDSTRILVFGLPRLFTQYDGHIVNGLCRIYLDGTLDTTFHSPIIPGNGGFRPNLVEEDGKFFIIGNFQVYNHPSEWFSMLKLNADGSLDTTFNNMGRPIDSASNGSQIGSVVKTPDNGYLVGGVFNQVQGYVKNAIVKLDSNGNIEPQYFTSRGPDTTILFQFQGGISNIVESKFGGYYVMGDWTHWDGVPTQPIIRIHEMQTVGLKKNEQESVLLKVYPNPVQEQLYLEFLPNARITSILFYDLQGKVVQSFHQKVNSISVNGLKNGIYFLKVISEHGVSTEKVVVGK